MAVGATDFALTHFSKYCRKAEPTACHIRDVRGLPGIRLVIKFQDYWVRFATVYAWVRRKVIVYGRPVTNLDPRRCFTMTLPPLLYVFAVPLTVILAITVTASAYDLRPPTL